MCVHDQSCPTLWDPVDCSPPGSSVRGIFQAGMLEWVAIAFSRKKKIVVNYISIKLATFITLKCTIQWH